MNGGTCQLKPSQTLFLLNLDLWLLFFRCLKTFTKKNTTNNRKFIFVEGKRSKLLNAVLELPRFWRIYDFVILCVLGSKLLWMCLVLGNGYNPNSGLYTIIRLPYGMLIRPFKRDLLTL